MSGPKMWERALEQRRLEKATERTAESGHGFASMDPAERRAICSAGGKKAQAIRRVPPATVDETAPKVGEGHTATPRASRPKDPEGFIGYVRRRLEEAGAKLLSADPVSPGGGGLLFVADVGGRIHKLEVRLQDEYWAIQTNNCPLSRSEVYRRLLGVGK
jgi:hypothetical protein